jgi:hypothetical protein
MARPGIYAYRGEELLTPSEQPTESGTHILGVPIICISDPSMDAPTVRPPPLPPCRGHAPTYPYALGGDVVLTRCEGCCGEMQISLDDALDDPLLCGPCRARIVASRAGIAHARTADFDPPDALLAKATPSATE